MPGLYEKHCVAGERLITWSTTQTCQYDTAAGDVTVDPCTPGPRTTNSLVLLDVTWVIHRRRNRMLQCDTRQVYIHNIGHWTSCTVLVL